MNAAELEKLFGSSSEVVATDGRHQLIVERLAPYLGPELAKEGEDSAGIVVLTGTRYGVVVGPRELMLANLAHLPRSAQVFGAKMATRTPPGSHWLLVAELTGVQQVTLALVHRDGIDGAIGAGGDA